jgi:geranylgeranyl diphosphate synthase type 3
MSNCVHLRDKQCLEPFAYLNQIPGKDVRGALIDCFNEWLQLPSDIILIIKDIISSLHNASLLVDDIEDNSKLRRGLPVAHSIFGIANRTDFCDIVIFLFVQKFTSVSPITTPRCFEKKLV